MDRLMLPGTTAKVTVALEEVRAQANNDHPDAFEWPLLFDHISRLRSGEVVEVPVYDYRTHTRSSLTRRVGPCRVRVV